MYITVELRRVDEFGAARGTGPRVMASLEFEACSDVDLRHLNAQASINIQRYPEHSHQDVVAAERKALIEAMSLLREGILELTA